MKDDYFDQDKADEDDLVLVQAIEEGIVPPTCLFSGAAVMALYKELNIQPCDRCAGPREKCKGYGKRGLTPSQKKFLGVE